MIEFTLPGAAVYVPKKETCEYCASTYWREHHRNGCPNCGAPAREVSTSHDAIADLNAALKYIDSLNWKAATLGI